MTEIINSLNQIILYLGDIMRAWIDYLDETDIGLNVAVRIIMIAVSTSVIIFLFKRMLRSQIKESAFLMWTLPAALLFIYGVWPELTYYIADLTHMAYGYALVVTVPFITLLYYIAFRYMCQIAALTSKVEELGSMVSLQKHEIEELQIQLDEIRRSDSSAQKPAQIPSAQTDTDSHEESSVEVLLH